MPNLTTNFEFNKPLVNNATDADLWGGQLNTNWDSIDVDLALTTSSKTADFTVSSDEFNYVYIIDASSNTVTATLPPVANVFNGFAVRFKPIDVTEVITIDGDGSETIGGETSVILGAIGQPLDVVSDGSNWLVIKNPAASPSDAAAGTSVLFSMTPKSTKQAIEAFSPIVQIVSTTIAAASGTSTIPKDNTAPEITEGTEIASIAITPSSDSSDIKIEASFTLSNVGGFEQVVSVFRDTTCIGVFERGDRIADRASVVSVDLIDSPATDVEVTYTMRTGNESGVETWYVNTTSSATYGGVMANSRLILSEIRG